ARRLRALLPRALRHWRRAQRGAREARRAQRTLRPRDAAGDGSGTARALRATDRGAAFRRLDTADVATGRPTAGRQWARRGDRLSAAFLDRDERPGPQPTQSALTCPRIRRGGATTRTASSAGTRRVSPPTPPGDRAVSGRGKSKRCRGLRRHGLW